MWWGGAGECDELSRRSSTCSWNLALPFFHLPVGPGTRRLLAPSISSVPMVYIGQRGWEHWPGEPAGPCCHCLDDTTTQSWKNLPLVN